MKPKLLSLLIMISLTGCTTITGSMNPLTLDSLAYSQYVGLKWLSLKLHEGCKEPSNIDSNLPLLISRSEELEIYTQHKRSSIAEKESSTKLVLAIRDFADQYQKEPERKMKKDICETGTMSISAILDDILNRLGGAEIPKTDTYKVSPW